MARALVMCNAFPHPPRYYRMFQRPFYRHLTPHTAHTTHAFLPPSYKNSKSHTSCSSSSHLLLHSLNSQSLSAFSTLPFSSKVRVLVLGTGRSVLFPILAQDEDMVWLGEKEKWVYGGNG
ncbi:hypothetical protein MRB53_027638 [Persea americana]|uniref:Uncharacterized protein n=1 Tax=Persea americana TaxID=3435 RepID=A0ACC2LLG4_PERAE|nr:hypothetical protein MRB53_027638 [Persea americana]